MRPKIFFPMITALIMLIISSVDLTAQDKKLIYNVDADANLDLNNAIEKAGKENKHIIIQFGGNWCKWCIKFHDFISQDAQIDSLVKTDYIYVLINYSKENRNADILKKFDYPQRFGFPVLVVLDSKGNRIHTQDTGYLEAGNDSYNRAKIISFLKNWNRNAMDPKNYITK